LQKHPNVRLFIEREGRAEARVPNSLLTILMMAVKKGENVTFRAEGEGAAEVLNRIQELNETEWFSGNRKKGLVAIRDIQGTEVGAIAAQLLEAMDHFREPELAAVFHPRTRRFVVGHILSTHKEIAKSAGFLEEESYLRMNLALSHGTLRACFAPGKDEETKAGRNYLLVWLRDLFRGVGTEIERAP
jgi:hypothetical protein